MIAMMTMRNRWDDDNKVNSHKKKRKIFFSLIIDLPSRSMMLLDYSHGHVRTYYVGAPVMASANYISRIFFLLLLLRCRQRTLCDDDDHVGCNFQMFVSWVRLRGGGEDWEETFNTSQYHINTNFDSFMSIFHVSRYTFHCIRSQHCIPFWKTII